MVNRPPDYVNSFMHTPQLTELQTFDKWGIYHWALTPWYKIGV
jgi:hypothetical protein